MTLIPTLIGTAGEAVLLPVLVLKITLFRKKEIYFTTSLSGKGVQGLHCQERVGVGIDLASSRCWRLWYHHCSSTVSLQWGDERQNGKCITIPLLNLQTSKPTFGPDSLYALKMIQYGLHPALKNNNQLIKFIFYYYHVFWCSQD